MAVFLLVLAKKSTECLTCRLCRSVKPQKNNWALPIKFLKIPKLGLELLTLLMQSSCCQRGIHDAGAVTMICLLPWHWAEILRFFFLEVLISKLLQLWQTGAWASVTALVSQVHYNFLWKSGEQSFLEELNPPLFSQSLLTLAVFHWDCDWAGAISNPPQKKIPSSSVESNLASEAHRLKYHCTYKLVTKVNCQVA